MLEDSQLKFKVHRDITLKCEGLVASATHWSGRESDLTGELGCTHDWVGMNGHQ